MKFGIDAKIGLLLFVTLTFYKLLAVSTSPPVGINYRTSRANSVMSFISTHQVAPATAPLLLLMLLRAWFMVIRQVAQA